MAEKITGIVLGVTKYNDSNNIVTLFTKERGRLSFISPSGSGKAANARRAKLQPLSVVTTDLNFKPNSELQRLGSLSSSEIWTDIYFHPVKRIIALFLSEFLGRLLYATMPDPALFDFLINSFRLLDRISDNISDYNIAFLVSLLPYSGIQPDIIPWQPGLVFDYASGTFVMETDAKGPFLKDTEAEAVEFVSRINFSNMKCLRLTNINRRQIFNSLLNYYSFHFPGLGSLKSPEIIREIFL